MLFSSIVAAQSHNYLDEKFCLAYQWLKETDLESLAAGSYSIRGQEVVANVQLYETFAPCQAAFETHERYYDIQYMVSGQEKFGICKRDGLIEKERIEEQDLIFYEEPELSGEVLLSAGDFIIVAPEDAHKPRCIAGTACQVKKIVIKVSVS